MKLIQTAPPAPSAVPAAPVEAPQQVVGYVKAATLAQLLDCAETTVHDYSKRGLLPKPRHIGGMTRWNWAEVEQMIEGRTFPGAEEDPILRASRGG